MKTARRGFSLLELVIGIMISTILMSAALTIYNQIGKGAGIVQKITMQDTKIMILKDRLSRDLAGISHRWFSEKVYSDLKKAKDSPKKSPEKASEDKKEEPKNSELKKEDKKIKSMHFFFSGTAENNLDFFTFITTNPMQIYGQTKTCFSRIVYKTIAEVNNPKALRLMRKQEDKGAQDIDKEKITDGSFYELAGNISKIEIEYGFTTPSKQEQEKNPEQKVSFKWIKKWSSDSGFEQKKEFRPLSPEAIKLNISFFLAEDKPDISHEIVCIVPQLDSEYPKSFAQKRSEAEKQTEAPKGGAENNSNNDSGEIYRKDQNDTYVKDPNGYYNVKDPNGYYRKIGNTYVPISNALQKDNVTVVKPGATHA